MIFLTAPPLEMIFLLDAFLFASDLYLYCNISNNARGGERREMVHPRRQGALLAEGHLLLGPACLVAT